MRGGSSTKKVFFDKTIGVLQKHFISETAPHVMQPGQDKVCKCIFNDNHDV